MGQVLVVVLDKLDDLGIEVIDGGKVSTVNHFSGQRAEPDLDLITFRPTPCRWSWAKLKKALEVANRTDAKRAKRKRSSKRAGQKARLLPRSRSPIRHEPVEPR